MGLKQLKETSVFAMLCAQAIRGDYEAVEKDAHYKVGFYSKGFLWIKAKNQTVLEIVSRENKKVRALGPREVIVVIKDKTFLDANLKKKEKLIYVIQGEKSLLNHSYIDVTIEGLDGLE